MVSSISESESIIFLTNICYDFFNWQTEKSNLLWPIRNIFSLAKTKKNQWNKLGNCRNFYYKKKEKNAQKFVRMLWLIEKKFSRNVWMVPKSQRTKSVSNADMQFILQSSNIVICLIFFWVGRLFKFGGKSFKCPNCGWFGQKLCWKSQSYFESLRIG